VPQVVPAAFGVPLTQLCAPVLHDVVPLKHALPGLVVQLEPAVQGTHEPLPLQTWLVPQLVPADFGVLSSHVCAPVEQPVRPLKQAWVELVVHTCPVGHAPDQAP